LIASLLIKLFNNCHQNDKSNYFLGIALAVFYFKTIMIKAVPTTN